MPWAWTISLAPTPEVHGVVIIGPDRLAADGVRPVEHDEARPDGDRRAHRRVHRPDVGVEARPDVLDVEDDGLDAGRAEQRRHLRRVGAVGVVDHEAGARVGVVALRVARLGGAAEAVLGPEDADDVDGAGLVHLVDDGAQVGEDARRVGDDPDLLPGEGRPAGRGRALGAGRHGVAGVCRRCRRLAAATDPAAAAGMATAPRAPAVSSCRRLRLVIWVAPCRGGRSVSRSGRGRTGRAPWPGRRRRGCRRAATPSARPRRRARGRPPRSRRGCRSTSRRRSGPR